MSKVVTIGYEFSSLDENPSIVRGPSTVTERCIASDRNHEPGTLKETSAPKSDTTDDMLDSV